MAYNTNQPTGSDKRDFYQDILVPNSGLELIKPKADKVTIIRVIPQFNENNQPMPMVIGHEPDGAGGFNYCFSNLHAEPIAVNAGLLDKFTGLANPSDLRGLNDFTRPWSALYPIWKGRQKKNELNPQELSVFAQATARPANAGAPLAQVQEQGLLQCAVIQLNNERLPQVKVGCIALFSKSGLQALVGEFKRAASLGMDLFDAQTGRTLIIKGKPKVGDQPQNFDVEIGEAFPFPATTRFWLDLEPRLQRYTYDEHIRKMVAAYGPQIVAKVAPFAEAMQRLGIAQAAPVQVIGQPAAPAMGMPTMPAAPQMGMPAAPAMGMPVQAPMQMPVQAAPTMPAAPAMQMPVQPAVVPTQAPAPMTMPGAPAMGMPTLPAAPAPTGMQMPTMQPTWTPAMANVAPVAAPASVPQAMPLSGNQEDMQKKYAEILKNTGTPAALPPTA